MDPSFGSGGILDLVPTLPGLPLSVVGEADHRAIMLSRSSQCGGGRCETSFWLTAYTGRGALDTSFGAAGHLRLPDAEWYGPLAADPRGRLLVVSIVDSQMVVMRLGPSGELDTSFGNGGTALGPAEQELAEPFLAVGEDGKIVVVARRLVVEGAPGFPFTSRLVVARFLPDGTPDPLFSGTGSTVAAIPSTNVERERAVLVEGSLVLAWWQCCASPSGLGMARILSDGSVDPGFAGPERPVVLPIDTATVSAVAAIVPRGGGTMDVVGRLFGSHGFLLRLDRDGRPVRSFGKDGLELFRVPFEAAVVDRRGRILAVGQRLESSGEPVTVIARLRPDGRLDRTFGNRGYSRGIQYSGDLLIGVHPDGSAIVVDRALPSCRGECPALPFAMRFRGGTAIRCMGHRATIVGTRRSDTLRGTPHRDVIAALAGNDEVRAGRGNDLVCGGDGRDELFGGPGRDRLVGGRGGDRLRQ